jgi:radical SAM superfamily enzyme YgiQ (UPF0313 family)
MIISSDIILATLHAKFIHSGLGLRYLLANMGALKPRTKLLEFDIKQRPIDIAEEILAANPTIVGLGIYIWNVTAATELASILKKSKPELLLILGGPEISYQTEDQAIASFADYIIAGEGDLVFAQVCQALLSGDRPASKIIQAPLPDLEKLVLPYDLYGDLDLKHRLVYVEASRGCPFACDFCLSAIERTVRQFPLPAFLVAMKDLWERGARHFKFIDRTFNLNIHTATAILDFFLERLSSDLFLHFEIVPDHLPEALREKIVQFPSGTIQLEAGIQTFNLEVSLRIHRRQDYASIEENLQFLRKQSGVHLHTDLLVGLPGETEESFGLGFDRLVALKPQEIQVGILKKLRGAPLALHDAEWEMSYNPFPPYEILSNKTLDFFQVQRLRHFARTWDQICNSGNFVETAPLIWEGSKSVYEAFMEWTVWLHDRLGRLHAVALARLMEMLFIFLTEHKRLPANRVAQNLWRDYQRGGRNDKLPFLMAYLSEADNCPGKRAANKLARRQARHSSEI